MARVKFVLKEPKSKKETLIYLMFTFNNQRLKYSTGELIHPNYWNKTSKRAKETKEFNEYPEFNARLDNLESEIKNVYRKMINDKKVVDVESLKDEFTKKLKGEEPKTTASFRDFIDGYIEESKATKSPLTIKSYNTSVFHIDAYFDSIGKKLNYNEIDLEFYNSYIAFLADKQKLSQNSIGKEIKNIKVFLNEATDRGLNLNLDFRKKRFKKLTEETDKVYLSQDEVDSIYNLDLSKSPYLDRARDVFIIGCCTGLRFSDFSQIKEENIIDGNKLKIRTQKTSETVVIPMHRYFRQIMDKYNNDLPRIISNQKMNEYIQKIAEEAKLNEDVETSITKAGELVKTIKKKHKLVTCHTARRSFATNMFLSGVPTISIMKITGHRTEKSFLKYIRISQEENANNLLDHPFFN